MRPRTMTIASAALLVSCAAHAQPGRFRAEPIPAFLDSGVRMAYAVADDGRVVGSQTQSVEIVNGTFHRTDAGFLFAERSATPIVPVGPGLSTNARARSSSGLIVGSAQSAQGSVAAILSTTLPPVQLPLPAGASSAMGVNASGLIVGMYTDPRGRHAFAWSMDGGLRDLTPPGGTLATAFGVNAAGVAVGEFTPSSPPGSTRRAFAAPADGVGIDLNLSLAADSPWILEQAWAISDAGHIACNGSLPGSSSRVARAAIIDPIDPANPIELVPVADFPATIVYGINAHGDAVGLSLFSLAVAARRPTLWRDGAAIDLSSRIVNVDRAARWNAVTGINSNGLIIGQYIPVSGGNVLCVLVPLCDADFDGDGTLDANDLVSFLAAFEHPISPLAADHNGDGFVDFFDFLGFIDAFETGTGCPGV